MDHKNSVPAPLVDEDIGTNDSANPHILDVLDARFTRRQTLLGGFSATAAAVFGSAGALTLAGCDNDDATPGLTLGFSPVAKSLADVVTVPPGYTASVLWALGDSFASADPAWSDTGAETAESYTRRAGDHHDGLYYFGLSASGTPSASANERGLLAMNHEAPNPFSTSSGANNLYVHPNGATTAVVDGVATRTVADEVRKEVNHHGVSIIEVRKNGNAWSVQKDSTFNRRITGATVMELTGPLRGNAAMATKFSPTGTQTQGTVNNCANGYTPWGTYLTCEENWAGYFARAADDDSKRSAAEVAALKRYGNSQGAKQRLNWNTAGATDEFQRWDTSVKGASAADDFRNVINQFGYVVEIDPYNPNAVPAKRTALGRFAHEGAWPGKLTAGKPVVFYMGDDNRCDYIYKFVSTANWDPADADAADRMATGAKYLDSGKLYVAKFLSNGTGEWIELTGTNAYLNTRVEADATGATRMDRPEWGAVDPRTGEVYMTLTNNNASSRLVTGAPSGNAALTDSANPRAYDNAGNPNGHIIRWREAGDDGAATMFQWDIYLFGARSTAADTVNISDLGADNDFSSPDGLWFGRPGNAAEGMLWIQTDDGAYTDVTNCMMLAAVPGRVGDGASREVTSTSGADSRTVTTFVGKSASTDNLRRFLVGPKDCEITGIDSTPNGKTLFVNIQHPGEGSASSPADIKADNSGAATYGSHWPDSQTNAASTQRPRSATIVITRNDGGVIGL
jgi:uncharacterized protein